jgi:secreted trypsin-like serine protease
MPPTILRAPLALLLPLLAACAAPPPLGEAAQAIIGGTVDPGDPAVVLLASYPSDLSVLDTCSATVISDTVLLTAAHCVDAASHPGYVYGVFPGADASPYPTLAELEPHLLAVSAVHAEPDYDPTAPYHADIAVAVLAAPLDVTPLPFNRAPLDASIVGQSARIIGYGQVVYGQVNETKNQATTVVDALGSDDTVTVGDSMRRSCIGDSGGPALVTLGGVETIVGVDSYTETTGCTEPANYRRPDLYTAFLDLYVSPPAEDAGADASTPADAGEGGGGGGAPVEPASKGGCSVAAGSGQGAGWAAAFVLALALAAMCRRGSGARA